MTSQNAIVGAFQLDGSELHGHAYDAGDLARRLVVEVLVDGWPVDLARADAFSSEAATVGDGCYGFGFELPDGILDQGGEVEVRVANTGEPIGGVSSLPDRGFAGARASGQVTWAGGLRLTGWVAAAAANDLADVTFMIDRRRVAETRAQGFVLVGKEMVRRPKARFDLRLPQVYADGVVHLVTVADASGRELAGSPCAVLAFADGLREALAGSRDPASEDPRVELVERILPRSVPFGDVEAWCARHPAPAVSRGREALVAVLLLGDEVEASLASLDRQDHTSWLAAAVPEADGPATFDPTVIARVLAAERDLEVVVVAPAGTVFRPQALARLCGPAMREAAPAYPDALLTTPSGAVPLLWPAFDPERQLEQGYAALAFAAPAAPVSAALAHGAASAFVLFAALAAATQPLHLPEVLVELPPPDRRLGDVLAAASRAGLLSAAAAEPDHETGLPVVHVRRSRSRSGIAVAVIQPEPSCPDLAQVAAALPAGAERLLVSHRPLAPPAGWRNLVVAGGRNPSRLRDAALRAVDSPHLLLLDAVVGPDGAEALDELADRLTGGAAAAGGLVLDEDGLVVSAGLVLGPHFASASAFVGLAPECGGYAGALRVARSVGALDAAALLLDRAAAVAVGGFDAVLFPERCGAVDLCLRLRAAARHLVVTPRARFIRRGTQPVRERGPSVEAELAVLRRRWGADLADDPFYHPGLNFDDEPFTGLAWPPRALVPRRPGMVRSPTRSTSTAPVDSPRRRRVLNVGSGPRDGRPLPPPFTPEAWDEVRVDIDPGAEPDHVASLTDMGTTLDDGSFDAVWSSHSLEHIHGFDVVNALREFRRVLGPDGFALVTCPDVEAVAAAVVEHGLDHVAYVSPAGPITLHDILYGHSSSIQDGAAAMAHRTGLTARRLGDLAIEAGFDGAAVGRGDGYDLWAVLTLAGTDGAALRRDLAHSPAAFVLASAVA
ncbi:methyltransferase domain-containing protein [Lichenibacterium dinghuense]|uniref:methyltransferase domain-containing protein n=1 Tax=Lichenibacterium dinghuense TaxID=2895977 RepID=UPI001F422843|nr:methyltransferase domain-containing protein [Lichenibacterium sp. 6Y81]